VARGQDPHEIHKGLMAAEPNEKRGDESPSFLLKMIVLEHRLLKDSSVTERDNI
jgi:hypothetical protein